MISDNVKRRIDNIVEQLEPFFEFNLSTKEEQINKNRDYIQVMCNLRDIDSEPYIEYYNRRVDEYDKKKNNNR